MPKQIPLPYPIVIPTGESKDGQAIWRLTEAFHLRLQTRLGACEWFIPRHTETDFASIPFWMRPLINPTHPKIIVAALIHDELYRLSRQEASAFTANGVGTTDSGVIEYNHSRFFADSLFRELMVLYGAPVWMRVVAYYGVRLGGWPYWES